MNNLTNLIKEILVDDRENNRIKYCMEQYAPYNPSISHLEYGDYLFKGYNGIDVVFEYKTGRDFLNSIQNNHLHNQIVEMITEYDYTFIIIEVNNLETLTKSYYYESGVDTSMEQVNGAITTYNTVSTILQGQSRKQCFDMMLRQATKIIAQKPFRWKYGKKSTNPALNYLGSIKHIDKYADIICKELNLHTLTDLQNLTMEDLTSIKGVGKKTAERIILSIKSGNYEL